MTDFTNDVVAEIDLYPDAREDNAWYYGCADAALGMRGIDYSALSSGGGQVEDERRHDERLLAPLHPDHRFGLWRRAWVELVTERLSREHAYLLRTAFTPIGWAWEDSPAKVHGKKFEPRERWEAELREALWIVRYPHKGGEFARFPTHAVCLIELGIVTGAVQLAAESHPAWAAARSAAGDTSDPTRAELLQFLRGIAEDALPENTNGRGQKARALIAGIRARAGAALMPALRAYSEARREVDQDKHPGALKRKHWDPRVDAYAMRQAGCYVTESRVTRRIARLQAVPSAD
jgi:hypothetical protein